MTVRQHPRSQQRTDPRWPAVRAPIGHAVVDLIHQADDHLAEAFGAPTVAQRFRSAHLAALRSAAAVLAAQAPDASAARRRRRRGPRSVWVELPEVAPALGEWAAYFVGTAAKREAVEAGITTAVDAADADDLLRQAETFRGLVSVFLGLPYQAPLAGSLARLVS
jgi:hypothetical protein